MLIDVIPFKTRHVLEMAMRPLTAEEYHVAQLAEGFGKSYTMCLYGDPIASAGIFAPVREGIGEAWTFLEHPIVKAGRLRMSLCLTRKVKELIPITMDELKIWRVIAPIDCDSEVNIKWIEALGFEREGRMRKYLRDRDFYLYARIRE